MKADSRDGSLWIGTGGGLVHLAGRELIQVSAMPSLVSAVTQDSHGTIWFSLGNPTEAGGRLCEVTGSSSHCHGTLSAADAIGVTALTSDANGGIFGMVPNRSSSAR